MDMQYHVDLMAIVIHERHEALLQEAQSERLFRQQHNKGAITSTLNKVLGQFHCYFDALRLHITW